MARQNLYFKGIPTDQSVTEDEVREYFGQFGAIQSIKLSSDENGGLLGFGFVCFQTLDQACQARHDAPKKPFRDRHCLSVQQFEPKEVRLARLTENEERRELAEHKIEMARIES